MTFSGRVLRSTIREDATLRLSLDFVSFGQPDDDEVMVRVEATPINPSDLGLLLGPADFTTMRRHGDDLVFDVPQARLGGVKLRLGQPLLVGNEGAGRVVSAGRNAKAFEGQLVAMSGGAMFADYRRIAARDVMVLPNDAAAIDGASLFINPLTALGFVETARCEGHSAIVHTAAASNLGQMLERICQADGIPLINIVRSPAQIELLRSIGARYVLDSRAAHFNEQLADLVAETGATIAFDAIGGGALGSQIVAEMERAAARKLTEFNRYGSDIYKQLYVYGGLDPAPIVFDRLPLGYQWSVSGWLLWPFLRKAGPDTVARLRARVIAEIKTTFASRYSRVIGLAEALEPEILRACESKATGEKYLINPSLG
jgi:NADPH:quinone reductase